MEIRVGFDYMVNSEDADMGKPCCLHFYTRIRERQNAESPPEIHFLCTLLTSHPDGRRICL